MNLKNNTILITGGASGIGWELTQQLVKKGNTVIITGRDANKLKKAKDKLPKIHTIQSDVSKPKEIDALFEQIQKNHPETNILINNAGVMKAINMHEPHNLETLTNEIEINLSGTIRMTSKFLPFLKAKKTAAIMNVSSGLAFVPLPIAPIYCATKAALHSFTVSLRVQMKKSHLKIFELAPPATQTEMIGSFDASDMKGVPIMKVEDMVAAAVKGMENDQLEIRPGSSNALKMMSRFAPGFILKQMSKPVDRMLSNTKH